MVSVTASEVQKNFGEWHDRAFEEPVEITRYGRSTAFLVSARLFHELMNSYRKAIPVEELEEGDLAALAKAEVQTDTPYRLDDIPDPEGSFKP